MVFINGIAPNEFTLSKLIVLLLSSASLITEHESTSFLSLNAKDYYLGRVSTDVARFNSLKYSIFYEGTVGVCVVGLVVGSNNIIYEFYSDFSKFVLK